MGYIALLIVYLKYTISIFQIVDVYTRHWMTTTIRMVALYQFTSYN